MESLAWRQGFDCILASGRRKPAGISDVSRSAHYRGADAPRSPGASDNGLREAATGQVGNLPHEIQPLTRRDVLRLAAGLGVAFAMPAMDLPAAMRRGNERPKSLITLWLAGGPSQLETWDPHPGGAVGETARAIPTRVRGLEIAEFYPQMAEQIDALSVIRSLVSKEGDHERGTYCLKTGYRPDPTVVHPALGAIAAHERPAAALEIPAYVSLAPSQWPGRGGYLGASYDAFKVFDPGRNIQNLQSPVRDERQQRRLQYLDALSRAFRQGRAGEADQTLHQATIGRALRMMGSEQLRAFDVQDEPRAIRDGYGDSPFGRGCLVARRLIEQGVRAVEVTLGGFDSHANNLDAHRRNAALLDPAFAQLVRDLRQRDLLDSTVILCIGEFGRTPTVNALGGRDHWPSGFSCVLGGGGLRAGVVLGATDPSGKRKEPDDPVPVPDLCATILSALGIDFARELVTPIGRPLALSTGIPVARLL